MVEKRWMGWQIPEDVQQEVSYLIALCERSPKGEDRRRINREINDLIVWAHNEVTSGHSGPRPDYSNYTQRHALSRREAIRAQKAKGV